MMYLTHLECTDCSATYEASVEQHRCACGGVLLARYDLAREVPRKQIAARSWSAGLWRYAELLPVERPEDRVTLGEGATPLLPVERLSVSLARRCG
jgi:threonine synthase